MQPRESSTPMEGPSISSWPMTRLNTQKIKMNPRVISSSFFAEYTSLYSKPSIYRLSFPGFFPLME